MSKTPQEIRHNLGVVHYNMATLSPSREQLYKQYVLDAIDWVMLAELREKAALELADQMETKGVRLKEQIAHLEQLLNGKPETEATVAAQGIGRGVDEAELKEG